MRETRTDTTLAVILALLVHLLPLLVLLAASQLRDGGPQTAGEPISAEFVDPNALPASMRNALRRAPESLRDPAPQPESPPEPLPEALPESEQTPQPEPQEQLPESDEQSQEEVRPDAPTPDTRDREQEAQQRQGQVDLTERERQEQEQRRLSDMERERLRQLEDIRRQRAEAERQRKLSEDRLRRLADLRAQQASDAAAATQAGSRGTDPNQLGEYKKALMEAIRSHWIRPDNVLATQRCRIVIKQIIGGEVIDAQVDPSCPYDEQGRRSIEAAVLKAQPLPYAGFERVFNRTLLLDFQAQDP